MFNIDKKYLTWALVVVLIVSIVCLLRCVLKGYGEKESFTDLDGSKKSVMITDENGNIELYPVNKLEGVRKGQLDALKSELMQEIKRVDGRVDATLEKATETATKVSTYFPEGNKYLKLNSENKLEGYHIDLLNGKRDIWIYNPNNNRNYDILSFDNAREAKWRPKDEANRREDRKFNSRLRIVTKGDDF